MGSKKIGGSNPKSIVLGIILARGGSKGIPDKNIVRLVNKPLIQYTIDAAKNSRLLTDFLLSTDSSRIASVARSLGCPVPFLRPAALATDKAKSIDAIRHAVLFYEWSTRRLVSSVLVLQPTSPLRSSGDIDRSIELLLRHANAESVVSFYETTHVHPNYMYRQGSVWVKPLVKGSKAKRRQDFDSVLIRNGAIYLVRRRTLMEKNSIMGKRILPYIMPRERSVNIDEFLDLAVASQLLKHHAR